MNSVDMVERAQVDALRTAMTILQSQDPITDEIVSHALLGALASIAAMHAVYGEVILDVDRLRRQIEERVTVWTATQSSLADDRDHVPWLAAERAEIDWRFWERYRAFIAEDLPPAALRQVSKITDDILGRLESPRREGAWDRRGMVVGQVQSGKTANYTGLICKAADAGYRLIIVLAGMHDSLRSQTQERLDEGFLGWDTQYGHTHKDGSRSHRTGVGAMVQNAKLLPVNTFTSSAAKGDFKRQVAQQVAPHIGSDPVVLVVKKHKTILENVIAWTTREKLRDPVTGRDLVMGQPLLVIDDEADNASVNTKEIEQELDSDGELKSETDPTAINRLIRQLLNGFQQSAYVGYTATPFANIFIFEDGAHSRYGEDLFPRSFIVRIPPPSNYVGAPRVFGLPAAEAPDGVALEGLPVIRDVDDTDAFIENRNDKNELIGPLPPSLREAVRAFVLTCAARAARGQGEKHCSMLVHVTRFVAVQKQVTDALSGAMEQIQQRLRYGEGERRDTEMGRLRQLWEDDYQKTYLKFDEADRGDPLTWDDIEPYLLAAAMKIQVRAVNGSSADALTYKDHRSTGLSVIAVGGDKLSRGLTLEGLAVSYYLRTSKMYDTLLQMGRWFGYRPGYLDLCRLYTTRELSDWYRDITIANEELNREFDAMAQSDASPRDYGLRVRSHPDGLLITARTKMRNAKEMRLSFAGVCPQTTVFDRRAGMQRHNAELVERFLRNQSVLQRHSAERPRGVHLWKEVPGTEIARFLEEFQVSAGARRVNGPLLARYIHECLSVGELRSWTVALPSRRDREDQSPRFADLALGRITRAQRKERGDHGSFAVQAVLNPPDETIDLTPGQLKRAAAATRQRFDAGTLKTKDGSPPSGPDGISARAERDPRNGLLILYGIDPIASDEDRDLASDIPLFGLAVSFPKTREERTIVYQVNNVFWQLELGGA